MNFRYALNQFSLLMLVLSGLLAVLGLGALIEAMVGDRTERVADWALLVTAGIGALGGGVMYRLTRTKRTLFGRREAMLLVSMSWLIGAALGALPFWIWARGWSHNTSFHPFASFIHCYFEAMSGLTTTGASVLTDIQAVPRSLLLWRSMTHWLGGLGIVVLFVAVLPSLGGAGGRKVYRVEAPGPTKEGVRPSIRDTARMLWLIYVGLTVAQVLALRAAGMPTWLEAISHTFATLATGGFSTLNASIGGYHSLAIDVIVIVFMFLAGVNFGLYYQLMHGKLRSVWRDTELRVYTAIMVGSAALITIMLVASGQPITTTSGEQVPATIANAAQYGAFMTASIQTTTGFANADYETWPFATKALLLALMFIGGSAGSTGGGIKVVRIWVAFKILWGELERNFRPNVVRAVRIGTHAIDTDMRLSILAYVLGILLLFGVGTGLLMVFEDGRTDFKTATTASLACLCNIGPGLGLVGPRGNYAFFTDASKLLLSLLMVMGRLEVFAVLVLLSPRFWRGH